MPSMQFGFSVTNLNNTGAVASAPFNSTKIITGFNFALSMGFLTGQTGSASVAYQALIMQSVPSLAQDGTLIGNLAGFSDIGALTVQGAPGLDVAAKMGSGLSNNWLFSEVLQTASQAAEIPPAQQIGASMTGINVQAPYGSYLVLYMLHGGALPASTAIQGVVFYQ